MIASLRKFISESLGIIINKVIAGLIIAFVLIMLSFSLSGLLFTGQLAPYFSQGVGIFLMSTAIGLVVMGILAHQYHIIPAMQSSLILIIASMTSGIAITTGKDLIATTLVLLPLTALIVGIIYFIFGQFRFVRFIRYVPYPVIGGFLAGNGVSLIIGALQLMTPFELTLNSVANLFLIDSLVVWLPALAMATLLFFALRQSQRYTVIPIVLILGVGAIYGIIYVQGQSIANAITQGILLGDIGSLQYELLYTLNPDLIDWRAIQSQWANILAVVMVAVIHLSLNLTGIELIKQDDFDIDEQVRSNGIMNIAIALAGGNVGFSSASTTTMNYRVGGKSRLTYVICGGAILTVIYFGS
ncbi:MAG: SulP family inorganic anion transporter, partial [Chloroflexota bacterium]